MGSRNQPFAIAILNVRQSPALLTGILFFASGFAALLYQVAWQRMLFSWYGVDLDSVSVIVSVFMLGLGVGAIVGGQIADRFPKDRILTFSLIEFTIGLFGIFSLGLIDSVGSFFVTSSLPYLVVLTFIFFLIPTCAMGATLPVLVTELVDRTKNVGFSTGSLYFVNTLGAAAGVGAAAFFILPHGGLDLVVTIAAMLNFLVCAAAYLTFRFPIRGSA